MTYYYSRKKAVHFLLLSLAMTGMSVFVIIIDRNQWYGWFGAFFFGLGIPLSFKQLVDREPRIIMDEEGIEDKSLKVGKIRWELIKGYYPFKIHNTDFVSLVIDEDQERELLATTHKVRQQLANLNPQWLGVERININLTGIAVKKQDFLMQLQKRIPGNTSQ